MQSNSVTTIQPGPLIHMESDTPPIPSYTVSQYVVYTLAFKILCVYTTKRTVSSSSGYINFLLVYTILAASVSL